MNNLIVDVHDSRIDPSVAVFKLQGHLDAQTVRELEGRFESQVKAAKVRSFVGVLSELRAQGGDILFVGLTPKMEKIFKVLGFTRIFKVFALEADAVQAFKGA
jgi:anti-anti-sigma regulatory factor